MQREMTKIEKILDNIALTSLGLLIITISTIFIHESSIEKLPNVIRHIFSFLHHHTAVVSFLSFGIMLIAGFWSAALGEILDNREQERSQRYVQKYVLSNDSNTKSRLELVKLKERG